jgi:CheY-like chemotaxis protein
MIKTLPPLLVVEDSDEDFEMLELALRKHQLPNPLVRFDDGAEALDYLFRRGRYCQASSSPRPALLLLDLNLPDTDGREVLEAIRSHSELKRLPVVVFTTSNSPKDMLYCYSLGINGYSLKPVNSEKLEEFVQIFVKYWFSLTVFPEVQ